MLKSALIRAMLSLVLALGQLQHSISYVVPNSIYLGGIFQSYGYVNDSLVTLAGGQQHLAAFLMAVDEINNRSDILTSTKIKYVINQGPIKDPIPGNTFYDGAAAAFDVVRSSPVLLQGAIVTSNLASNLAAIEVLSTYKVPELTTQSGQTSVARGPMSLQVPPPDFNDVLSIKTLLPWKEVGIFYSSDSFGLVSFSRFTGDTSRTINLQFAYSIPEGTTDFSSYIRNAKGIGTTIFLVFMDATSTGLLLEQGYLAKLFTLNTQVIGTSKAACADIWKAMSPQANVVNIMRGYLSLQLTPELYFQTAPGIQFLSRLRSRTSTKSATLGSCSQAIDDGESFGSFQHNNLLYQIPSKCCSLSGNKTCLGMESYEVFNSNGSNVDPLILYTYDAVYTFATAVDNMISQQLTITGTSVYDFLLNPNTTTAGITGNISFIASSEADQYRARGQSRSSGIYTILNFNANLYKQSNGTMGFAEVGYYEQRIGLKLCKDILSSDSIQLPGCQDIIFNTAGDGSIRPTGIKADHYIGLNSSYKVLFLFLCLFMLIQQCYQFYFVIRYFKEREMRNAQPKILLVMLLGGLSGSVYMFFNIFDVQYYACYIKFVAGHVMILATFVPFQMKLWRIYKIVSATPFTKIRITENKVLLFLVAIMIISLVLVAAIAAVGNISTLYLISYSKNQRILEAYCAPPNTVTGEALYYLLISYEIALVLSSIRFLWLTRGVPSYINELSTIIPVFAGCLLIVLGAALLYFLVPMSYDLQLVLINVVVFFTISWGTTAYFYDKRKRLIKRKQGIIPYTLLSNVPEGNDISIRRADDSSQQQDDRSVLKFKLDPELSELSWEGMVFVNGMIQSKEDLITKAKLCQEQLFLWTSVMLKLKEMEEEEMMLLARERQSSTTTQGLRRRQTNNTESRFGGFDQSRSQFVAGTPPRSTDPNASAKALQDEVNLFLQPGSRGGAEKQINISKFSNSDSGSGSNGNGNRNNISNNNISNNISKSNSSNVNSNVNSNADSKINSINGSPKDRSDDSEGNNTPVMGFSSNTKYRITSHVSNVSISIDTFNDVEPTNNVELHGGSASADDDDTVVPFDNS